MNMLKFKGTVTAIAEDGATFRIRLDGGSEVCIDPTPDLPSDFDLTVGEVIEAVGNWMAKLPPGSEPEIFHAREVRRPKPDEVC